MPTRFALRTGTLLFGGGVFVDLVSLLHDDLHIFLAGVFHYGEVFLREYFGHVHMHYHGDHQRYGEDHRHVEQIDHHAQRIGVFLYGELAFSAGRFHASVFFSISFRDT